jgi:hypothetical protein
MDSNQPAILDDGLLHFALRASDGSERQCAVDALMLRLTCEECVEAHHLPVGPNGRYVVTTAFLSDLAGRIAALGVEPCTPSIAYQLWVSGDAELERVKKNTSETPKSDSGLDETPAE